MAWLCAVLNGNQQNLAIKNLARQSYTHFLPVFAVRKLRYGRPTTVMTPVFGCYIFIELLNGQRWMPIKNTSGISRVLVKGTRDAEGYDEPAIIPEEFIRSLKQVTTREDRAYVLQPGTRVRILRGPMIAHEAVFTAMTGTDRCAILIDLLQRRIRVELSVFDVESVEQP